MDDSHGQRRPWLTRNLLVVSWVSFFQDAASELLYPILPIFLTTTLGAPVAVVGITEGVADGAASLTKIVAGRLSDRQGRKGLVGVGYGMAAAAKVAIAAATVWPLVTAARVLDRLGKGVRGAPRDALIADTTSPEHLGKAYGLHRTMDTAGAVVGPLLGLLLYEALHHEIRPLLVVATVPAVVSVLLVSLLREPRHQSAIARSTATLADGPLPRAYWRVVVVLSAFAVVNFSDALLLLRARALGLGTVAVIGVYCVFNLTYAALSYPAGALSDRIPRRIVFAAGLVVFAVMYVGLGVATTEAAAWVLFPIYGAFAALTDGVSRAWVAELVPATSRGRALGLQQGLSGGGLILAGAWAGLLWGDAGRAPLVVAGVVAAALAAVLLVGGRTFDRRELGAAIR